MFQDNDLESMSYNGTIQDNDLGSTSRKGMFQDNVLKSTSRKEINKQKSGKLLIISRSNRFPIVYTKILISIFNFQFFYTDACITKDDGDDKSCVTKNGPWCVTQCGNAEYTCHIHTGR